MNPNQQFEQKNLEYCDVNKMKSKYAKLTNISGGIFSLFNILLDYLMNHVE